MVELMSILGYALSFIIPSIIIGFGAMFDENETCLILAYINFITLISYFVYLGFIPVWILVFILIILSFLLTMMYKAILGGN